MGTERDATELYNFGWQELFRWQNIFKKRFPMENDVIFYKKKEFHAMLDVVLCERKQYSPKPFDPKHANKKQSCMDRFHAQFWFLPSRQYTGIIREWKNRMDMILVDPLVKEDDDKVLPFTEELVYVLFNYFATHGWCPLKKWI